MSITRKVKFEYYEVVSKYKNDPDNSRDRVFDLRRLIEKAYKMSLEARTFDYYQEQVRLDRLWFDDINGFWFLNLARLRSTNIPSKASDCKELEPIELEDDEYIGEDITCLYDESINVLMLQRNRYSLGPNGIEEYLNLLWDNKEETIYIRPICLLNPEENAKKALYYRKLNIRFADLPVNKLDNWNDNSLKNIIKAFGSFDAINAEVVITVGRTKDTTLNRNTVHESIKEIYEHKDIISKAELAKKDVEDSNVEVIDLFEHKIHDYLYFTLEERQSLGCENVAYRMYEKYLERNGELINCTRNKA